MILPSPEEFLLAKFIWHPRLPLKNHDLISVLPRLVMMIIIIIIEKNGVKI